MSDDEGDAAFQAEQARREAMTRKIEEAEARAEKDKRRQELEEARKAANDPAQRRDEFAKLREAAKEKKREQKNEVDSDDDAPKEDEAMEGEESDHDEENSEPGVSDQSSEEEKEAVEEEEEEEQSETESEIVRRNEEKARRKVARKFMDIDAAMSDDETTEAKKLLKEIRKKHGKKASLHDAESEREETPSDKEFIEGDEEVTYDTDFEEELRKKNKLKKKKNNKAEREETREETHKKKSFKRKRAIASSSEEEESAAEEQHESKDEKPQPTKRNEPEVFDTDDSMLENMVLMEQENSANRKPAKFHDHADIAKAAADKKNKPVDPQSLVDTPKKAPKAPTKPKNSPANGGKKKAANRGADKPKFEVGEDFQNGQKAWVVRYRTSDFPMARGHNGLAYDQTCNDITLLSTCELVETTPDGAYKNTGTFDMFFISKEYTKPKKLAQGNTQAMWEGFLATSPDKAKKLILQACECENLQDKKRLLLPPATWKKVSKECNKVNGEWKWEPKKPKAAAPSQPIPSTPPTLSSQPSFSERVTKAATPPGSGRQQSNSNKSTASKKPKTSHNNNESGTHDIAQMLQRSSKPTAASATAVDDDDDPFKSMFAPSIKKDSFDSAGPMLSKVMAECLKGILQMNPDKEKLKKAYAETTIKMRELEKNDSLSKNEKYTMLTRIMDYQRGTDQHPFFALMYFLPFLNPEAAVVTREIIYGR